MNQSWSIIIFTYNEEETIASVIRSACDFVKEANSHNEVIIVDDGSTDRSEQIIRDILKSNNEVRYIRHSQNFGIGPALLTGYKNAKMENVVAIPGDGQFDINELNDYRIFPEKTFLSFYRIEMTEYSLYRKAITYSNKLFNKYLLKFDIKDINWVKAYKTKNLMSLDLKLKSSLVGSEICAKFSVDGFKAIEILSVQNQRVGGTARGASIKTLTSAVNEVFKLIMLIRKYKKNKHQSL